MVLNDFVELSREHCGTAHSEAYIQLMDKFCILEEPLGLKLAYLLKIQTGRYAVNGLHPELQRFDDLSQLNDLASPN